MLLDKTLLRISCSSCPTIYVNKHLSRLTYRRAPTKGSNPIITRNQHITATCKVLKLRNVRVVLCTICPTQYFIDKASRSVIFFWYRDSEHLALYMLTS